MQGLVRKKRLIAGVISLSVFLVGCDGPKEDVVKTAVEPAAELTKAEAVPTTKSTVNPMVNLPVISPTLPKVVDFDGLSTVNLKTLQKRFDIFSWQSFIALNWPANTDGSADTGVNIGEKPGAMTVWQHYKESRDIFLPGGAVPPAWGEANPPPSVCTGSVARPVLNQVGKTPNVLDESGEPFKTGPLIDQNGQYTRFEILTNEVMFDYIVDNALYSKEGQSDFTGSADFPFGCDNSTNSPDAIPKPDCTSASGSVWGALMVKSSWKVMGDNDDTSKFHTTKAYVYNNPDENEGVIASCSLQTVGMVGLHIATKVDTAKQWVWSTFEHIDNAPTQGEPANKAYYNYFDPNCTDCSVNEPPARPWDPATAHTTPSQIERVIPIDPATQALNASYHESLNNLVANSVWTNYELVNTQWPTNENDPVDLTGVPAPTFLANTTLETYIQGHVEQTSSSCIGCHNNAGMTNGAFSDFTYLLQRAQ